MTIPRYLKKGAVLKLEDEPYLVVDFWEAKTAQRRGTVRAKLRSLKSGRVIERTLDERSPVEPAETRSRPMQFLYRDKSGFVFMDTETFDQVTLPSEVLEEVEAFLEPEKEYRVLLVDDEPLHVELPAAVVMEVTETAPPAKGTGSGSGNVYKEAVLASGLKVMVPLFIKVGDRIRVSTETREYLGKE